MPNEVGERIREAREAKDMSQEELGKACGTTKQTIYKYESGVVTNVPLDRIEKIADVLGVSAAYLVGWNEDIDFPSNILPMPAMRKIPLVGTIACGTPILAEQNIECDVDIPEHIHADFALRCKGDSMINARIYDGDIVYIRSQPEVEHGEIAAVEIDGEGTLKRVYIFPDQVVLQAENPLYEPRVYKGEQLADLRILGKAVGFTAQIQ